MYARRTETDKEFRMTCFGIDIVNSYTIEIANNKDDNTFMKTNKKINCHLVYIYHCSPPAELIWDFWRRKKITKNEQSMYCFHISTVLSV